MRPKELAINRTRVFPAYSAAPQPVAPPGAPLLKADPENFPSAECNMKPHEKKCDISFDYSLLTCIVFMITGKRPC